MSRIQGMNAALMFPYLPLNLAAVQKGRVNGGDIYPLDSRAVTVQVLAEPEMMSSEKSLSICCTTKGMYYCIPCIPLSLPLALSKGQIKIIKIWASSQRSYTEFRLHRPNMLQAALDTNLGSVFSFYHCNLDSSDPWFVSGFLSLY